MYSTTTPALQVLDWGFTDDEERTHELVEMLVGLGTAVAAGAPPRAR
jgi:hypothetical protein